MKKLLTVAATLLCMISFAQPVPSIREEKNNTLSEREKAEKWKLLFDGETTKGWHSFNKTEAGSAWKVKDGELYLDTTKKNGWQTAGGGDLTSDKTYSNFHLKLEWKISKAGNSGIIFYAQEDGKHNNSWETGPEMQIAGEENEDGNIKKHQAGDLYDLIACYQKTVKPAGEWNQVEIISTKGGGLVLMLNNVKVVSTKVGGKDWIKLVAGSKFIEMPDFGKSQTGKIALQDHGALVSFRNIKIKEL